MGQSSLYLTRIITHCPVPQRSVLEELLSECGHRIESTHRNIICKYNPIPLRYERSNYHHLALSRTPPTVLRCLECPAPNQSCLGAQLLYGFDAAAKRHVCRMQLREVWRHDRVAVDALTWIDTVGSSARLVTEDLSFAESQRCRKLVTDIFWKSVCLISNGYQSRGMLNNGCYRNTLDSILKSSVLPPLAEARNEPPSRLAYWRRRGFLPQQGVTRRSFTWPDAVKSEAMPGTRVPARRRYHSYWVSLGVLSEHSPFLPQGQQHRDFRHLEMHRMNRELCPGRFKIKLWKGEQQFRQGSPKDFYHSSRALNVLWV